MKNKLIKPKDIDNILSKGIVLRSWKAYYKCFNIEAVKINKHMICQIFCAVRNKDNPRCPITKAGTCSCSDIDACRHCFLNADNYLNVLKYIKHHGQISKTAENK